MTIELSVRVFLRFTLKMPEKYIAATGERCKVSSSDTQQFQLCKALPPVSVTEDKMHTFIRNLG